jgi:hypothetical protein
MARRHSSAQTATGSNLASIRTGLAYLERHLNEDVVRLQAGKP